MNLNNFIRKYKNIPEVQQLKLYSQDFKSHSEGNVWNHTFKVLKILGNSSEIMLWAGLLHDIGKPETFGKNKYGRITFYDHEKISVNMVSSILSRYGYSNKFINHVCNIIKNHMKIKRIEEMRLSKRNKLMSNPYINEIIKLSVADSKAGSGNLEWYKFIKTIK